MTPSNLLSSVTSMLGSANIASVQGESYMEQVRIESKQGRAYDVWNLNNTVQHMDSIRYKMASFATIEKGQAPQSVRKTDQQYNLILQYDYIGSPQSGEKILKQYIEEFKETIPVGYTIKNDRNYWNWNESAGQYLVLTYRRNNIFPVFHTFQFAQATGCSNNGDTDIPYRPIRHVLPFRHTRGPGMLRRNDTAQRYYGQRLHIHP